MNKETEANSTEMLAHAFLTSTMTAKLCTSSDYYSDVPVLEQSKKMYAEKLHEISMLKQQLNSKNVEIQALHKHYNTYFDLAYQVNIEMHRQAVINTRLTSIIADISPKLDEKMRDTLRLSLNKAKTVSHDDLDKSVKSHYDEAMEQMRENLMTLYNRVIEKGDTVPVPPVVPSVEITTEQDDADPKGVRKESLIKQTKDPKSRKESIVAPQNFTSAMLPYAVDFVAKPMDSLVQLAKLQYRKETGTDSTSSFITKGKNDQKRIKLEPNTDPLPSFDRSLLERNAHLAPEVTKILFPGDSLPRSEFGPFAIEVPATTGQSKGIPKEIKPLCTLPTSDITSSVGFMGSNGRVITGSQGQVRLWDVNEYSVAKSVFEFDVLNGHFVRKVAITSDSNTMCIGGEWEKIILMDISNGSKPVLLGEINPDCRQVYDLIVSPNNQHLFVAQSDGIVSVWDIKEQRKMKQFHGHRDAVTSLSLSADGTKLISGSLDSSIKVFDMIKPSQLASYTTLGQVISLSASKRGSWVTAGLENSLIQSFDLTDSQYMYKLQLHGKSVLSIKYSNNSEWFISGGKDRMISVWGGPDRESIFQYREASPVICTDISPNDGRIVSGSSLKVATLYEVVTGTETETE